MLRLRLILALLPALAGCTLQGQVFDPTVRVRANGQEELGVATPHGVVYLGHLVTETSVELLPAFGDGPAFERSTSIEIAPGLRLAKSEITLPNVEIDFGEVRPGSHVLVRGRAGGQLWEREVRVVRREGTSGLLLEPDGGVRNRVQKGLVGAGVYRLDRRGKPRLVGLVDGLVTIGDRTYLGVAGGGHLWKVVAHERSPDRERRVYRDDIL